MYIVGIMAFPKILILISISGNLINLFFESNYIDKQVSRDLN